MSKIIIGILMIVAGAFYLNYNIKKIRTKMNESSAFGKSILVEGFIGSIVLILVGLILVIKYF